MEHSHQFQTCISNMVLYVNMSSKTDGFEQQIFPLNLFCRWKVDIPSKMTSYIKQIYDKSMFWKAIHTFILKICPFYAQPVVVSVLPKLNKILFAFLSYSFFFFFYVCYASLYYNDY